MGGDAPRGIDLVHPFEGWFADAIDLDPRWAAAGPSRPLAKRGTPGTATSAPGGGEQSQADAGSGAGLRICPKRAATGFSYRAQPLTLTKGVAPSRPAIGYLVAPGDLLPALGASSSPTARGAPPDRVTTGFPPAAVHQRDHMR